MGVEEKQIKGTRCRFYGFGQFWVGENGKVVAVKSRQKISFSEIPTTKVIEIETIQDGEHYVTVKGVKYLIRNAVYRCFCYWPKDGKEYEVVYKDGNKDNLHYKNLDLKEKVYIPPTVTTEDKVKLNNGLTITKEGEVYQGKKKVDIYDFIYDSDADLFCCINPYVSNPKESRQRISVEELMDTAGYIHGDKKAFKMPGVLHRDNDPYNCKSDNLEWVDTTDSRYQEYEQARKEYRHNRNVELNPNKPLHPGW